MRDGIYEIFQHSSDRPSLWEDRQHAAMRWCFGGLGWQEKRLACARHIVSRGGVEKRALLEEIGRWSHSEQILVMVGLDLFDPGCVEQCGHGAATFGEAAACLDHGNMRRVLEGLAIARGETTIKDLLGGREAGGAQ